MYQGFLRFIQLKCAEERETAKATNDMEKWVDKRTDTLLEHFAKSHRPIDILIWSEQWRHLSTVFNATVAIILQ